MLDKTIYMGSLYEKFHKRIFDFLYKYTNNQEVASDLMQETFFSYFRSYGDSNLPPEKAIMVLYTIARNASINYSKKFSTVKENASNVDIYQSKKTSFEKREELKDMEMRLQQCLALLPEDQRVALIMKNMKDMTLMEIAEVMELSISTVSRLVVKATARLVELAEKHGIAP
jgi:RNA polymerase sigma factor (sigma-70 family)